ncbi:hypothetical protein D3C76_764280 [compost metagenome]
MQVGQDEKQVEAGEHHRHRRPEKEPVDLRCRVVHRSKEAARHGRQDHRRAAVGPAQQNPQHRGDNDRNDGGGGGIEHQATIEEGGQAPQAPMPIDRAPTVLAFALDRVLQAAAVLPQIDPLAEAINGVGEQQLLAIIQHFGAGLQCFELVFEGLPALDVSVLVLEPFGGGGEQGSELVHQLGGASFQGVECIVEGIDHRQQVNHPPAQLLGVAHRLWPRAFVGQLADHQFKGIERGHHRAAQRADFLGLHVAVEKARAVDRRVGKPFAHRVVEHRGQPSRPEHGANHRGDGDAQENFLGARFGHVPHRQRVIHHRQGDQRQGVAGQHQGVIVGGAQMHGQEQQGPGPQRDDHHQHIRALHEHRHEQDSRSGTQKSADRTVQRLGAGRPDKRAGNDVNGSHRPIRTRHLHEQGDVQRDHRGREGAYAVEPVPRWGEAGKKAVQGLSSDGCPAASKAFNTRRVASRSRGSIPSSTSLRNRTSSTSTVCTRMRPLSVRLRHLARRSWASSVRQT